MSDLRQFIVDISPPHARDSIEIDADNAYEAVLAAQRYVELNHPGWKVDGVEILDAAEPSYLEVLGTCPSCGTPILEGSDDDEVTVSCLCGNSVFESGEEPQ